jgi:uncharacterized membrane protein YfcA
VNEAEAVSRRAPVLAFIAGAAVGLLGGLVGLGGAEFRLPLLIAVFGFAALAAVIVNKAMSLIVVIVAIPARLVAVPLSDMTAHWGVVVNLLLGSLVGAWVGASWATRVRSATLYRVIAGLLVAIAVVFAGSHWGVLPDFGLSGPALFMAGIVAGFVIGVVAAVMGVAGGELLIPTITVLYGLDVKLAGSLSLLVSLPTMLVAFLRYSRTQAFVVLRQVPAFVFAMAVGSIVGTVLGGMLLGVVPGAVIGPIVVLLLLASAWKVWQHSSE